jgi:hypothetical protein
MIPALSAGNPCTATFVLCVSKLVEVLVLAITFLVPLALPVTEPLFPGARPLLDPLLATLAVAEVLVVEAAPAVINMVLKKTSVPVYVVDVTLMPLTSGPLADKVHAAKVVPWSVQSSTAVLQVDQYRTQRASIVDLLEIVTVIIEAIAPSDSEWTLHYRERTGIWTIWIG